MYINPSFLTNLKTKSPTHGQGGACALRQVGRSVCGLLRVLVVLSVIRTANIL